jgi:hypothetical protein
LRKNAPVISGALEPLAYFASGYGFVHSKLNANVLMGYFEGGQQDELEQ